MYLHKEYRRTIREEAREAGLAEGRAQGRSEIIMFMINNGKSAEEISTATGLDIGEIKSVSAKM